MMAQAISSLLVLTVALNLIASGASNRGTQVLHNAKPSQKEVVKQKGELGQKEVAMSEFIHCYKLIDEKKYDAALAAGYNALKASRAIKEDVLETEVLKLLGTIEMQIGNEFVGAKLFQDQTVKYFGELKAIGLVGYYKKAASTYIDLMNFDEEYLFYNIKSGFPFEGFTQLNDKIQVMIDEAETSDEELPEDRKKILLVFKTRLEKINEKLTRSIAQKNIKSLKESCIEIFDFFDDVAKAASKFSEEEDLEDIEMMRQLIKNSKNLLKAYIAKDKAKTSSVIEIYFGPFDDVMRKEGEGSFEEKLKEALVEFQERLNATGEEIFRQMFKVNSAKSAMNIYLLHFMKADKTIEPMLKRYGYVTLSDLLPYKETIVEAVNQVKEEMKEKDNVALPAVFVSEDYGASGNAIAINSAFSPEGQWLYTDNSAFLFTAKEEVSELINRTKEFERRTKINHVYSQSNLLLRNAVISFDEGNLSEALSYLRQALSNFQKRMDNELIWETYFMMGLIYKKQGDLAQAIGCLKDSIKVIEGMRSSFRAENIRALVIEERIVVYELLIDLLVRAKNNGEAFAYVEKTKARILLDRFWDPRMKSMPSPKNTAVKTIHSTLEKIDELQQSKLRGEVTLDSQVLDNLNEKIKAENGKYQSALEEFRYSNPEFASVISGETIPIELIQKLIDEDSVIVEYYISTEKVFIFVIGSKGEVEVTTSNIPYQDLEEKIHSYRDQIETQADDYATLARELYSILIAPVENRIQRKRLCIVPYGALHFLPFQALMKGDNYLIQNHQIFYSPSSSVLKYAFDKRRVSKGRVLIVANPLGNLRLAEEEAKEVATIFPNSKLFLGKDAAKPRILEALGDVDILHFATHANLNQENPLLSHLVLANDATLSVADIYGLELKANLVILSACQTHLGKLTTGDEVVGLTRSFIFAGVPSVVTSLWQVSDDSTSRLMVAFYRRLIKEGTTKVEALRQAQIEMIKGSDPYSHPRNWAQFVLVGDFR